MQREEWRDIEETNGKYQISNYGGWRTVDHYAKNGHSNKRFVKGVIRRPYIRKDGYALAIFYYEGRRWTRYIHHLVWKYFGDGQKSDNKIALDHIDNNKLNNHINNLRLITYRENVSKGLLLKKNRINSQYVGVYWRKEKNRWFSTIDNNKITYGLGYYKTEYEAAMAYNYGLTIVNFFSDLLNDKNKLRETVKLLVRKTLYHIKCLH